MVGRALLDDDVIVARLTDLLKGLRRLPSSAQQLSRLVRCRSRGFWGFVTMAAASQSHSPWQGEHGPAQGPAPAAQQRAAALLPGVPLLLAACSTQPARHAQCTVCNTLWSHRGTCHGGQCAARQDACVSG